VVPYVVYQPFKFLFFYFLASWFEICFELRHFSVFMKVHATMYHVGSWLPVLICIFANFLPKVRKPRAASQAAKTGDKTQDAKSPQTKKQEDDLTTESTLDQKK